MITQDSIAWACRVLEDFYTIHKDKGTRDMAEAVTVLREGYGIDDELANLYVEWIHKFVGEQHDEPMLLGLLVGVMASEFDRW